jgi:hypothetical protein
MGIRSAISHPPSFAIPHLTAFTSTPPLHTPTPTQSNPINYHVPLQAHPPRLVASSLCCTQPTYARSHARGDDMPCSRRVHSGLHLCVHLLRDQDRDPSGGNSTDHSRHHADLGHYAGRHSYRQPGLPDHLLCQDDPAQRRTLQQWTRRRCPTSSVTAYCYVSTARMEAAIRCDVRDRGGSALVVQENRGGQR